MSDLDKLLAKYTELPKSEQKKLAESLGILIGSIITRLWLRKLGATRLQRYVATGVLTGIATTNLRLATIIKLLEAQSENADLKTVVNNLFTTVGNSDEPTKPNDLLRYARTAPRL